MQRYRAKYNYVYIFPVGTYNGELSMAILPTNTNNGELSHTSNGH